MTLLLLLLACADDAADSRAPDSDAPVDPDCPEAAAPCASDCAPGPASVQHPAWHNRLTESPALSWTAVAGAVGYELALGEAGGTELLCWTATGAGTEAALTGLFGLEAGMTVVPLVRAVFEDGGVSEPAAGPGWAIDILPPSTPTALDDDRAPVNGRVSWEHDLQDEASGFVGFELAVGTAPGSDDAMGWTTMGEALSADLSALSLAEGAWHWLSVRALDAAGNRSEPATSPGFITCPARYSFVPGDAALETTPFCVATYEMRAAGHDDGDIGFDASILAESRPTGTPWVNMDKTNARVACDNIGFSYQLITNDQWQAVARSVERTAENWSGGAVGSGALSRGHSDEDPLQALASDGDPCIGTNNPGCEDPGSADWSQRRTHTLHNGAVVWDLAGNVQEQVDGATTGPEGYWMSFDDPAFTTEEGWEDFRRDFAPAGAFNEDQGVGRMYGGDGNLTRGGSFDPYAPRTGNSQGSLDVGVFSAHHNTWNDGVTEGFRCVFVPM